MSLIDLELVEVEAMQREQAAVAFADARNSMVELLLEHGPVGQAGQHVVESELGNTLLAFGDLADHLVEAAGKPRQFVLPRTRTWTCSPDASRPAASSSRASGWVIRPAAFHVAQRNDEQAEQRHDAKRPLQPAGIDHVGHRDRRCNSNGQHRAGEQDRRLKRQPRDQRAECVARARRGPYAPSARIKKPTVNAHPAKVVIEALVTARTDAKSQPAWGQSFRAIPRMT